MKHKMTAREFLHGFGKVHQKLGPGQSVIVTKHGKALGKFVKESTTRTRLPDFRKEASSDGYGPKVGDQLLRRILADEAIC